MPEAVHKLGPVQGKGLAGGHSLPRTQGWGFAGGQLLLPREVPRPLRSTPSLEKERIFSSKTAVRTLDYIYICEYVCVCVHIYIHIYTPVCVYTYI